MKAVPGTLQAGGIPFPTTHWSAVVAPASGGGADAEAALTWLCQEYWPPLYSFVRRSGHNAHDAQDLTQGFFAYLFETKVYLRADRTRGRFRSFLLGTLKHFLSATREHHGRIKRGGDTAFIRLDERFDEAEALYAADLPAASAPDAEHLFERRWAEALVTRALVALQSEYSDESKAAIFRELEPFLRGGSGLPTQEEIAARLEIPVPTLRSHLSRMRSHYRETLRAEIARTVIHPNEVDEELRYLCEVLIAAG